MVRELFEMARTKKACLIFFDEIDAIGGELSRNEDKLSVVTWKSGLIRRTQDLMLSAKECGFDSQSFKLIPFSKALNHNCFVKVVHSALPARLL